MKKLLSFFVLMITCHCPGIAQPGSINQALIGDFAQGEVIVSRSFQNCSRDYVLGNCATIAVIKAALATFGSINNVYNVFNPLAGGGYHIVFADNVAVDISAEEITLVRQLSGITDKGNKYYSDAMIIYASICKRVLQLKERPKCVQNFTNSVEYINSGYSTSAAHELLGLKKKDIQPGALASTPAAVIWCSAHAAYCTMGVQDLKGKNMPIKNGKKMRNMARYSRIKGAYILTK